MGSFSNPLFFLFGITALTLTFTESISIKRLVAIFCLLILSCFTKETGVLFVIISLVNIYLFKRKFFSLFLTLSIATVLFYFLIRFGIGLDFATSYSSPISQLPLSGRFMSIPVIFYYYTYSFFIPIQLVANQQWVITTFSYRTFYFPIFIDILLLILVSFQGFYLSKISKKSFKLFIFFITWFLLGIIIHLQLTPLNMTVADRWFYFPMVGLLGLLGISIQRVIIRNVKLRWVVVVFSVLIIFILAITTIGRNRYWHDTLTLFIHDSKIHTNYDIENLIGLELSQHQKYDEAIIHFTKSVEFSSKAANIYNLAETYEKKGDMQKAKEYYYDLLARNKFITSSNKLALMFTYQRLARILFLENNYSAAKEVTTVGLTHFPNSVQLLIILSLFPV